jgi:hypothetical protein
MAATETQEIIRSLSEFKSETSVALGGLQAKVDGIIRRLDVSNGRIAQHERAIQDLRVHESEIRVLLRHLEADRAGQVAHQRRYRIAMFERFLWLVAAIILALVVHFAGF